MKNYSIDIIKSSGLKDPFSEEKLKKSLKIIGVDSNLVEQILLKVKNELYEGISTKEIYNRAFSLLKKEKGHLASKYKLKKAIYELGPTGFPFERFISAILKYSGYSTEVGKIFEGKCISHEVDVVAKKNNKVTTVECKFHSEQGLKCNVKVPLYINSRYKDIVRNWGKYLKVIGDLESCWVVTNTRFTKDAVQYANCVGLYLLSWDYPENDSLKDRINRLGLYPITVSTLLTEEEKEFLLSRDIVLCRDLINDAFYLDKCGISKARKEKIFNEIQRICKC
ncbi:ATP cone domain-containing protein [Urechidicola vernalis]|uniref:ATPase n=1 Tax=Urechidicola vernalis TaxID=3075600 RepID=A0ABU2Y1P6_9FLAO|nr:ATP cone domain-containing protein [Urechidicola sp. P050]MDT0552129.1 ATPase [Urechidicola sp. P050]